jgi:hypothetical protein
LNPLKDSFANLIVNGLSASLLESTGFDTPGSPSVDSIRTVLEVGIKSVSFRLKVKRSIFTKLTPSEKISVRRMMSRYWNNSSIFSLDLVGAVIRQGTFIEKMHALDWLHSPTLTSTMARLIDKYVRFFAIIQKYPSQVAVPTLDVDLAWYEPIMISFRDITPILIFP